MRIRRITSHAKKEFINYMDHHKKALKRETMCSGIHDIRNNIEDYFIVELREREHHDVYSMIKHNNNVFGVKAMRKWISEPQHFPQSIKRLLVAASTHLSNVVQLPLDGGPLVQSFERQQ